MFHLNENQIIKFFNLSKGPMQDWNGLIHHSFNSLEIWKTPVTRHRIEARNPNILKDKITLKKKGRAPKEINKP